MAQQEHAPIPLDDLDRDGALRETAEAVSGLSRETLLRRGALAAGGLALGALPVGWAVAQGGLSSGDKKILNFALTLEYLEAEFYKEAIAKAGLTGVAATFASTVRDHEVAHVQALQSTLGADAVKQPSFDFKGTTSSESKFLATAKTLEDVGVSAYQGQAVRIKAPAVLMAAASILSVEARHAGWIRFINSNGTGGVNHLPAPDTFDASATEKQILRAVGRTGFITGS